MKSEFILTTVTEDWAEHLPAIKETMEQAEQIVLARTDKVADPLLDTPNHPNLRGYFRWVLVQKLLERAVENERFPGISYEWVNLGGVYTLELRSKFTTVTPCHLLTESQTPNDTIYRRDLRIQNQINPLLLGFESLEQAVPNNTPLRILLVHGGKEKAFAYLRVYTDPEKQNVYSDLTKNIMLLPMVRMSLDAEPISEPKVDLKDVASEKVGAAREISRMTSRDAALRRPSIAQSDRTKVGTKK
ncbi:MAG TPA: hypothetical protein VIK28_07390 [Sedimentisphaerales bacterium]